MFTIAPTLANSKKEAVRAVLTTELLEEIASRAAAVDQNNIFPEEDFAALKRSGYLGALSPQEMGGLSWSYQQISYAQRLLAGAAPATALSINMHLVWNSVARLMLRQLPEHERMNKVLKESVQGILYAFGISEPGNDAVLLDSLTTTATPDGQGNYDLEGLKIFTSMAPAFDRLGVFGKDESASEQEQLVYGFIDRESPGWNIIHNWDMLGMRGTQSQAIELTGVKLLSQNVIAKIPTGSSPDPIIFSIFASFLTLIAAVYTGIGDRALQVASQALQKRKGHVGQKQSGFESLAENPVLRDRIGEAGMEAINMDGLLMNLCAALDNPTMDLGPAWFSQFVTARTRASAYALNMATTALELAGGASFHREHELSRLYRDATAGIFHPSSKASARSTVSDWILD